MSLFFYELISGPFASLKIIFVNVKVVQLIIKALIVLEQIFQSFLV